MVQDNFGLKEENAKLRDRMLELERELAEIRRLDKSKREALDARLRKLETRAPNPGPGAPQSNQRSGCLAQIFG